MRNTITLLGLALLSMPPAFAAESGALFTRWAGFQLGIGTLADVQERLGPTRWVHTGDAGDARTSICYATREGDIFFLSGELGGKKRDLLGFETD